jgi:tetratricopeptide (TPR) repeat protein
VAVILAGLVWAVFGQSARFRFVNYDDQTYIYDNPVVQRGLTWKGLGWALTYGGIGHWHPLTWLTHMIDCQLFGQWAGGHHLTNVFFQSLAAVFLFCALHAMTGKVWRSAFVAAVFAIHPLRAESVAWISERKDVLSGLFFMLTLWSYARYVRQPNPLRLGLTVALYALGLLSKNMLVTLPFVLLLLDWWPLGRLRPNPGLEVFSPATKETVRALLREKIPLFLLSVASCVATVLVPERVGASARVALGARMANAVQSYVIYLRQLFFPVRLEIPYLAATEHNPAWLFLVSCGLLLAITTIAVFNARKRPYIMVGWLWYLGMLVPAIGLVQISYYTHADRYTYLPEIGIAIAVAWAIAEWTAHWRWHTAITGGAMGLVVATLAIMCHKQTSYWHDNFSLWPWVIKCDPRNEIAHFCLGSALFDRGQVDSAITEYEKVLAINPRDAQTQCNLGLALWQEGRTNEAVARYHRALKLESDYAEAWGNLGVALYDRGEKEQSIAAYRKALQIKPEYPEGWSYLGVALFDKGEKDAAASACRKAVELKPDYAEAWVNLGVVLLDEKRTNDARASYARAIQCDPLNAKAEYNLGDLLASEGNVTEATAHFRRAITLQPRSARANFGFASALSATGQMEEAIIYYRKATELDPQSADNFAALGLACFQAGKNREAIAAWERGLEIDPKQPSVQNNLAWVLATSAQDTLRNGSQAVALAEKANQLTDGDSPAVLHTLAAAYAEAGRFSDAKRTAQRALAGARIQKNEELVTRLQKEMVLYESGKPLRDLPP